MWVRFIWPELNASFIPLPKAKFNSMLLKKKKKSEVGGMYRILPNSDLNKFEGFNKVGQGSYTTKQRKDIPLPFKEEMSISKALAYSAHSKRLFWF